MKKGMTLARLAEELDFQHEHKRDFIVSTQEMIIRYTGQWTIRFADYTRKRREFTYRMTPYMLNQIAAWTNVPMSLITRMTDYGSTPAEHEAISRLITVRLQEHSAQRLIRTLVGGPNRNAEFARAFLSDRYRVIDNQELLQQAVFPVMQSLKGRVKLVSCMVTENHLYIKLSHPAVTASLGRVKYKGAKVDDIVEAGVVISNSEVGAGFVRVRPYLIRLACENGMTVTMPLKSSKTVHLGPKLDSAIEYDNSKFFSEVQSQIMEVVGNRSFFRGLVRKLRDTKQWTIDDKDQFNTILKNLGRQFKLTPNELELIEAKYYYTGDSTGSFFDVINAITRASAAKGISYDRASEFEEIGGQLANFELEDWAKLKRERGKT